MTATTPKPNRCGSECHRAALLTPRTALATLPAGQNAPEGRLRAFRDAQNGAASRPVTPTATPISPFGGY